MIFPIILFSIAMVMFIIAMANINRTDLTKTIIYSLLGYTYLAAAIWALNRIAGIL